MAARVLRSVRSRRDQLRRLAFVYKFDLRLKIVSELYIRPMSPKEFREEFGGGTLSKVCDHFKALEKGGWLRQVTTKGPDSERRGGIEHYYRAIELPFFDAETWELLPYSVRLSFSWNTFMANASELRMGIEKPSVGDLRRDLSCESLRLDQAGWNRVIGALDTQFESIFDEQEDARIRVARTGEELLRIRVFLAGFESAEADSQPTIELAHYPPAGSMSFVERLSPVFADDLCMQIVSMANQGEITVRQAHAQCADGASEGAVRHRFKRLTTASWLAVTREVNRRAARERVYRAVVPAAVDSGPWSNASQELRESQIWKEFESLAKLVKGAICTGRFDQRTDRHLTCSVIALDLEGWERVAGGLKSLSTLLDEVSGEAKRRIKAGAEPLTMTVAYAADAEPMAREDS